MEMFDLPGFFKNKAFEHSREAVRYGVVIPARNESVVIGRCLLALANSKSVDLTSVAVLIVSNNSNDGTMDKIRQVAKDLPLPVIATEYTVRTSSGVGLVRRYGCELARETFPALEGILTTDADGVVAADWVYRNVMHMKQFDICCGLIEPDLTGLKTLPLAVQRGELWEWYYRLTCQQFGALVSPSSSGIDFGAVANGASLAFRLSALEKLGGFRDLCTGEDRDIVARGREAGCKVIFASDVRVIASVRLDGRAPAGMASTLVGRLNNPYSFADEALISVDHLLLAVSVNNPENSVSVKRRLRLSELQKETRRLKTLMSLLTRLDEGERNAYLSSITKNLGHSRVAG